MSELVGDENDILGKSSKLSELKVSSSKSTIMYIKLYINKLYRSFDIKASIDGFKSAQIVMFLLLQLT